MRGFDNMNRFCCLAKDISGDLIIINDLAQVHHIKNVLKLKPQEKVAVFDELGNEFICVIDKIDRLVVLDIKKRIDKRIKKFNLTVACAIPKNCKFDDIVDKLTQLGVDRIIPLNTERVIVRLNKHKESLRLNRWKTIALSAAKQSQRNSVPIVDSVKSLNEVVSETRDFDLKLIPTLEGMRKTLKEVLPDLNKKINLNVIVLIGPEGDFTEKEVSLSKQVDFIPITLGDLVMRVDTAAIFIASCIRVYEID